MQIINQITATSCKFWMWKHKWGCCPGIPISGLAGPGSTSQNASMYVELLKGDLCDPQMWMKAEMRRWRWGHFRRRGLPEQSPDLWCGLTVRDYSRAFELEEEERVQSLLFSFLNAHILLLQVWEAMSTLVKTPLVRYRHFFMASNTLSIPSH